MAEIVKIKKDGVIQYPITKPECVIDENGKNVLQLIKENGGGGSSYDDTELREAIEALDNRVAAHSEEIVNLQENKADKSELTELSAEVGKKQDTITDLETIRSGAAKGATALQSVPDTYATKEYVANLLGTIINGDY